MLLHQNSKVTHGFPLTKNSPVLICNYIIRTIALVFSGSSKPLNLNAKVTKSQTRFSMMMKFTEPSIHIGSIVQYQVQCIRDNVETIMKITSTNETIVTITNLIPLAKYQCKVSYIFYYSTED